MIFLTIGTQLPFDRLTRAVDEWAGAHPDVEVTGQIADPGRHGYKPRNFPWEASIPPSTFNDMVDRSSLVVAHAGMGSILTALNRGRPILILPRSGELGEHRNDHQIATARRMGEKRGVHVAWETEELGPMIDDLMRRSEQGGVEEIGAYAEPSLIAALRNQILGQ